MTAPGSAPSLAAGRARTIHLDPAPVTRSGAGQPNHHRRD